MVLNIFQEDISPITFCLYQEISHFISSTYQFCDLLNKAFALTQKFASTNHT